MITTRTHTYLGMTVIIAAGLLAVAVSAQLSSARAANAEGTKMLIHDVYFSLKDSNEANRRKLVDACDKYLSDHPGTVFYAAGTVSDLNRSVNDRDWDVGLHVAFKDKASHDAYQDAPKHLKFIKENKDTWSKVRVFDTEASGSKRN